MDDDHLSAGIGGKGVVGAVSEPGPAEVAGGKHEPAVAEVHMNPRGRDQLTTMVSVDRLTCPPHGVRGGQPGQHITVAQDQFHPDILAHRPAGRDIGREAAAHG